MVINNKIGDEMCSDDGDERFSDNSGGRWSGDGGKSVMVVVLVIFCEDEVLIVHNERTNEKGDGPFFLNII